MNNSIFEVGTKVNFAANIMFRGKIHEIIDDKEAVVLWRWKQLPIRCAISNLKRFGSELEEINNLLDTTSRDELDCLEYGYRLRFIDSYSLRHGVSIFLSSDIWDLLRVEFELDSKNKAIL